MASHRSATSSDLVFKALSDPTRRAILEALSTASMPAGSIASLFPISGPSVSRHLAVLRSAGLVSERRDANKIIYSLERGPLVTIVGAWFAALCPGQLSDDAEMAQGTRQKATKPSHKKKNTKSGTKRKHKGAGTAGAVAAPSSEAPRPPAPALNPGAG